MCRKLPYNTSTSKLEPSQEVTPLLLLAMFAICSRYSDEEISRSQLNDETHEPGKEYLQNALAILSENSWTCSLVLWELNWSQHRISIVLVRQQFKPCSYLDIVNLERVRLFSLLIERSSYVIPGSMEQGWIFIGKCETNWLPYLWSANLC